MQKLAVSILFGSLLALPLAASAQQMKPGLWEMTTKSDAMKNMPKMSPEQLAQMKKMGINVPQYSDAGMTQKICITKEMAARDTPPMEQQSASCQPKNQKVSGNTYSVDIVCNGPDLKGTGHSKGSYSGGTAFQSTYEFKGTSHGQPVNQKMESSGKWLAADCGSVKPIGAPGAK